MFHTPAVLLTAVERSVPNNGIVWSSVETFASIADVARFRTHHTPTHLDGQRVRPTTSRTDDGRIRLHLWRVA